jgi:3-oxoacyl-[acyl-carrier-protein] synthase-1
MVSVPPTDTRTRAVYIGRVAMITPVGLSAPTSCAAMRAGISRLQDLGIFHPTSEPLVGAYVEAADSADAEIHVHLLTVCLRELTVDWSPADIAETAWFLCLSDPRRVGRPARIERWLLPKLESRLGWSLPTDRVWVIQAGRTAVLRGLREARQLLTRGGVGRCVVAGVESGVDETSVAWLYKTHRLKTPENPDGLHPGEAAAAAEILATPLASGLDVRVTGLGFGVEPNPIGSDLPCRADGLTEAVRSALAEAQLDIGDLDGRLSDVTGEQYYFRETSLVVGRLLRRHKDGFPLWHCADAIGDVGAAVGAVLLGMAATALRKGYAPGPNLICQTSADNGGRAAAIVQAGG